jgi:hypothetical protein
MKKIIFSFLALSLIALCFSINLNAQSSEKDLDQVELMKQIEGTWIQEIGGDSTVTVKFIQFEKGYEIVANFQAKGETYSSGKGIVGFSGEDQMIVMYWLWSDGRLIGDFGKFVIDTQINWERYTGDHKHVLCKYETKFINPDKFINTWRCRGMKDTWDGVEPVEQVLIREKK